MGREGAAKGRGGEGTGWRGSGWAAVGPRWLKEWRGGGNGGAGVGAQGQGQGQGQGGPPRFGAGGGHRRQLARGWGRVRKRGKHALASVRREQLDYAGVLAQGKHLVPLLWVWVYVCGCGCVWRGGVGVCVERENIEGGPRDPAATACLDFYNNDNRTAALGTPGIWALSLEVRLCPEVDADGAPVDSRRRDPPHSWSPGNASNM